MWAIRSEVFDVFLVLFLYQGIPRKKTKSTKVFAHSEDLYKAFTSFYQFHFFSLAFKGSHRLPICSMKTELKTIGWDPCCLGRWDLVKPEAQPFSTTAESLFQKLPGGVKRWMDGVVFFFFGEIHFLCVGSFFDLEDMQKWYLLGGRWMAKRKTKKNQMFFLMCSRHDGRFWNGRFCWFWKYWEYIHYNVQWVESLEALVASLGDTNVLFHTKLLLTKKHPESAFKKENTFFSFQTLEKNKKKPKKFPSKEYQNTILRFQFIGFHHGLVNLVNHLLLPFGCWTKNRGILPPKWMVKIMKNPIF